MLFSVFARSLATVVALLAFWAGGAALAAAPQTERVYLSGKGPGSAVPWEFTVTGGRRAGETATIPVPSMWEQHGFGTYSYGQQGAPRADEHGLYKLRFTPSADLRGKRVRLVFEGVMSDATVKVNGVLAGPTHHGSFLPLQLRRHLDA